MTLVNDFLNANVKYFTKDEHAVHEIYFRENLGHLSAGAALLFRGLSKPLGYAGDYQTMRMCYDDTYEGTTLLGKLMHKYATEFTRSQAVRNRRELIAQNAYGKYNIMSVACGPASEVALLAANVPSTTVSITLLDQDKEALDFARATLHHHTNIGIKYVNISIYSIIKDRDIQLGGYDFIYSMGLFDYLDDKAAKRLCSRLVDMLSPNGTLIIGNFHGRCPNRYFIQYWCDWPLFYRTEAEMYAMIPDSGIKYASKIVYEATRTQMFLTIHKVSSKL
jgi:extracellular factor (EF) 3-hydroxypalmitic acid methyl ester biosynthesis protein